MTVDLKEAKRLAVALRVFVHDTIQRPFNAIAIGREAKFIASADPYNDENLLSHSSLVQTHMSSAGCG